MRVSACAQDGVENFQRRQWRGAVLLAFGILTAAPALAFDGASPNPPEKIPLKNFNSVQQALRVGLDDLKAGDAQSSVPALTYAAEGGQAIARWKLGEMYADGVGVARDDLKAYHYFNQLVEDYDEDQPDRRNLSLISRAFVAVGVYCLHGIPNSEVRPDAERAHELFQYAAATFGDSDAQYNLANMYIAGVGGLPKDSVTAVRWLALAAAKGHRPSQALLGHMLFNGDGAAHQRARGLMWLEIAKEGAQDPKDEWIRELYRQDSAAASDEDRQAAASLLDARAKGSAPTAFVAKTLVKALNVLRPLSGLPAPSPPAASPPAAQ